MTRPTKLRGWALAVSIGAAKKFSPTRAAPGSAAFLWDSAAGVLAEVLAVVLSVLLLGIVEPPSGYSQK